MKIVWVAYCVGHGKVVCDNYKEARDTLTEYRSCYERSDGFVYPRLIRSVDYDNMKEWDGFQHEPPEPTIAEERVDE